MNTIYLHKYPDNSFSVIGQIQDEKEVINVGFSCFKEERALSEVNYWKENYPVRVIIWTHI